MGCEERVENSALPAFVIDDEENGMFDLNRMVAGGSLVLLVASGCASPSVTSKEYSEPRETLAAARQVGTTETQQASLYMQYAEENLEHADKLIAEEEHDRARYYLDRAEADAELALAYAERASTKQDLEKLEARIDELRSESL
jgi:hypothetical protein